MDCGLVEMPPDNKQDVFTGFAQSGQLQLVLKSFDCGAGDVTKPADSMLSGTSFISSFETKLAFDEIYLIFSTS